MITLVDDEYVDDEMLKVIQWDMNDKNEVLCVLKVHGIEHDDEVDFSVMQIHMHVEHVDEIDTIE